MFARVLVIVLTVVVVVQAAALAAVFVKARHQRRVPDSFRCRMRIRNPRLRRGSSARHSQPGWASWAHGVLLVRTGLLGRVDVLPVRFPEGAVTSTSREEARGLGPAPIMVLLRLDDNRLIELAAPAEAHDLVAGPFLAACVMSPDR
jgi:hypothetical protein